MQTNHGPLVPSPLPPEKKMLIAVLGTFLGEMMPVSAYINLKLSLSLIHAIMLNLTSNLSLALRSFRRLFPNLGL